MCVCVCVCKGRGVRACGISGEMATKALILGSKLIKAVEQMAQTRSGHNETVSGETNRTWQDSCAGFFARWPALSHLPGVRGVLQPGGEGTTTTWKLSSQLFKKQVRWAVFTSSRPVFFFCFFFCRTTFTGSEKRRANAVSLIFFFSYTQSFDLGSWLLVNTKSVTKHLLPEPLPVCQL